MASGATADPPGPLEALDCRLSVIAYMYWSEFMFSASGVSPSAAGDSSLTRLAAGAGGGWRAGARHAVEDEAVDAVAAIPGNSFSEVSSGAAFGTALLSQSLLGS